MNKKGFTLIELLASLTLILVLMAIIIPMSLNLLDKSNKEQCEKIVNVIESGAKLCYLDKFDECYTDNSIDVSLNTLYQNGYIDIDGNYKSESTGKNIDLNNYSVKIDVSAGYPKYTFNNTDDFCGS